jgi:hypothetical protein
MHSGRCGPLSTRARACKSHSVRLGDRRRKLPDLSKAECIEANTKAQDELSFRAFSRL